MAPATVLRNEPTKKQARVVWTQLLKKRASRSNSTGSLQASGKGERQWTLEVSKGAYDIGIERFKQMGKWGAVHDDTHDDQMLIAEAADLIDSVLGANGIGSRRDAWKLIAKHPDARERLVVAGALIAAEIDRLDRHEARTRRGG
jgi:hypothetical protein